MIDTKAVALFKEIEEKTASRKLAWEPTAMEGIFVVPIKGKFVLKAYSYTETEAGAGRIGPPSFTLFDGDEIVVDINYRVGGVSTEQLNGLYALVRRQALKTDEKIDDVLSELKKL
jgi:hypothetical protein